MAPGDYTVRLRAGETQATERVNVLKDPNTAGTAADIAETTALALAIYDDINAVVDMINELESTSQQLEVLRRMAGQVPARKEAVEATLALDAKARAIEDDLMQPTLVEGDLKSFRGELKLYLKLLWLQAELVSGGGDVAGNADFPPTAAQREVYGELAARLAGVKSRFAVFYDSEVPAFDRQLGLLGVGRIVRVGQR